MPTGFLVETYLQRSFQYKFGLIDRSIKQAPPSSPIYFHLWLWMFVSCDYNMLTEWQEIIYKIGFFLMHAYGWIYGSMSIPMYDGCMQFWNNLVAWIVFSDKVNFLLGSFIKCCLLRYDESWKCRLPHVFVYWELIKL